LERIKPGPPDKSPVSCNSYCCSRDKMSSMAENSSLR